MPAGYLDPTTGSRLFVEKDAEGNVRSSVIEIHIGQKEESNEAEWEKIRQAVNAIDHDEIPDPERRKDDLGRVMTVPNPYNVVVSVMMLKEGWDVRNVKVIVPHAPLRLAHAHRADPRPRPAQDARADPRRRREGGAPRRGALRDAAPLVQAAHREPRDRRPRGGEGLGRDRPPARVRAGGADGGRGGARGARRAARALRGPARGQDRLEEHVRRQQAPRI